MLALFPFFRPEGDAHELPVKQARPQRPKRKATPANWTNQTESREATAAFDVTDLCAVNNRIVRFLLLFLCCCLLPTFSSRFADCFDELQSLAAAPLTGSSVAAALARSLPIDPSTAKRAQILQPKREAISPMTPSSSSFSILCGPLFFDYLAPTGVIDAGFPKLRTAAVYSATGARLPTKTTEIRFHFTRRSKSALLSSVV